MFYDDEQQQKIVELHHGLALVLAAPGCGKTHILAKRVCHAAVRYGQAFEKMLCVTFTNRAARDMEARIEGYLGHRPEGLFVGNMHRFCLRFLYANGLIGADTTVMDEEDQTEFLAETFGLTTEKAVRDFLNKKEYLFGTENDFPPYLVRRPYTPVTDDDCGRIQAYRRYQDENRLIDFDDILLLTYNSLLQEDTSGYAMTGYEWAQVDEVQDMTPLQLAILDAVTRPANRTVVYFGDEQQAIFRFIGAGGPALDRLKDICANHIYRLHRNYRSPGNLVDMCNELAARWLAIPRELLPESSDASGEAGELICWRAPAYVLPRQTAAQTLRWLREYPALSTAVLVRTNRTGDELSSLFTKLGIRHFHISRQDLFHQIPFKTVWCHLAVVAQPLQAQPWARLLYQMRAVKTLGGARNLVNTLLANGTNPAELLDFDSDGAVLRLSKAVSDDTVVVVFDTETTGLDIFGDDVVQIAAVKMRGSEIVDGSRFEVFIRTDKALPEKLAGGVANPLVDVYRHAEKLEPSDAFQRFVDYIGEATVLAGHNLAFNKAVVANNIRRRTGMEPPAVFRFGTPCLDTLEIARLLLPRRKSYRLADLIECLGVEGTNSHLASDDALATAGLIRALAPLAASVADACRRCRRSPSVRKAAERLTRAYGEYYRCWRTRFFTAGGSLADAIDDAAGWFAGHGYTPEIQRLDYVLRLVGSDVVDSVAEASFNSQLSAHLYDLLSFAESDLFAAGIVEEQVSIMTIHKAKGLEMPNVIVHDATDTFGSSDDVARLLYVAFSRARRRLAVGMSSEPSGALATVINHFDRISCY